MRTDSKRHWNQPASIGDAEPVFELPERVPGVVSEEPVKEAVWVSPGDGFTVDGRRIEGGMVYVGNALRSARSYAVEPALINPYLPVRWADPDRRGEGSLGYWPSYKNISPQARAAYLEWLAGGRRDPDINIGYVFLFFYGLERRVLFDLGAGSSHPDVAAITAEVSELLGIYREVKSFRQYASKFLDFVAALQTADTRKAIPESPNGDWAGSAAVVGIGRMAAEGRHISAEWMLGYFHLHSDGWNRTSANRCRSEFDNLFKMRYRARYGQGITLRSSRNLRIWYQTASDGFSGIPWKANLELPDVTSDRETIRSIRELAEGCAGDLDAYSRYVGRYPASRAVPAATALLPDDLLDNYPSFLSDWHDWLVDVLGEERMVLVPFQRVLTAWSPHSADKIAKKDALLMSLLLAWVGVGIEPDVRFGAALPKPDIGAVLFRLTESEEGGVRSPRYATLLSVAHLTAVAARGSGPVRLSAWEVFARYIENAHLRADEISRLKARLTLVAAQSPGLAGMKNRVELIPVAERPRVGELLVEAAVAGGDINPDAVKVLVKMFDYLGLEDVEVFRHLYALGIGEAAEPEGETDVEPETDTPDGQPVGIPDPADPLALLEAGLMEILEMEASETVEVPTVDTPGSLVVVAPDTRVPVVDLSQPGATLDFEKIEETLAATARVAELLGEIFIDESGEATIEVRVPEEPVSDISIPSLIEGLDITHSRFVERIIGEPTWNRQHLERVAGELGLPLLAGALDLINEACLDYCEEPLTEGEDPVAVNGYALEEILS